MKQYICPICGYIYNPENGLPEQHIEPNTPFSSLSSDFKCPICGAPKSQFEPYDETMDN